jgi:transposase
MKDTDLYTKILGIQSPWRVKDVDLDLSQETVSVFVEPEPGAELTCPKCGVICPGYDKRRRQWRHLDTCQYKTLLITDLPRVECPDHGVVTTHVPWGEPGSGFTALFEALVIDWLKEASTQAVCRQLKISWNAIDGIMQRAVTRGLRRRQATAPKRIAVDETSFRKRHDYVTVVSDHETGTVQHVSLGRRKADLVEYFDTLTPEQKESVEAITMDMAPSYISAASDEIPFALDKISFDKFHVAKMLGEAVDKVRRQEHKALLVQGCSELTGTKHVWLTSRANMSINQLIWFKKLRESSLKTARAWALKETAMGLWHYVSRTWALKGWKKWLSWAFRSRLPQIRKVAWTVKNHLWGILNAIVLKANNGLAESLNSRIKMIKIRSRGFRNKERFRAAIYFHLGGLDLYPEAARR